MRDSRGSGLDRGSGPVPGTTRSGTGAPRRAKRVADPISPEAGGVGTVTPHHNEIGASGVRARQDHRAHGAHRHNSTDDSRAVRG